MTELDARPAGRWARTRTSAAAVPPQALTSAPSSLAPRAATSAVIVPPRAAASAVSRTEVNEP